MYLHMNVLSRFVSQLILCRRFPFLLYFYEITFEHSQIPCRSAVSVHSQRGGTHAQKNCWKSTDNASDFCVETDTAPNRRFALYNCYLEIKLATLEGPAHWLFLPWGYVIMQFADIPDGRHNKKVAQTRTLEPNVVFWSHKLRFRILLLSF